ncbi:type II toxin-antitoxin system mRNA interferase toxin YafO [Sessilibacter corallicola]|uniref:Type II toxin-antitoxin system mRNA interferase toxin YafO n=2 Tax=Sessilibacter corallicola TaxID=2904075 RepID=A0ABQ0A4T5_9GAMM
MVKIFVHKKLRDAMNEEKLTTLVKSFRAYKEGKKLPSIFGRDAPYDHTHNRQYLDLQHIHFRESGFPLKILQFNRTSRFVLVYCPGFFNSNHYLLIAIINHWNHRQPDVIEDTDRDRNLMVILEGIAEGFREKF